MSDVELIEELNQFTWPVDVRHLVDELYYRWIILRSTTRKPAQSAPQEAVPTASDG